MKKIVLYFNDKTVLSLDYSTQVWFEVMDNSKTQIQAIIDGKQTVIMKSAINFAQIEG